MLRPYAMISLFVISSGRDMTHEHRHSKMDFRL